MPDAQNIPKSFRVDTVEAFKQFVSPAYDNHSYDAIIALRSYHQFEYYMLNDRSKLRLQPIDNNKFETSRCDHNRVIMEVKFKRKGGTIRRASDVCYPCRYADGRISMGCHQPVNGTDKARKAAHHRAHPPYISVWEKRNNVNVRVMIPNPLYAP